MMWYLIPTTSPFMTTSTMFTNALQIMNNSMKTSMITVKTTLITEMSGTLTTMTMIITTWPIQSSTTGTLMSICTMEISLRTMMNWTTLCLIILTMTTMVLMTGRITTTPTSCLTIWMSTSSWVLSTMETRIITSMKTMGMTTMTTMTTLTTMIMRRESTITQECLSAEMPRRVSQGQTGESSIMQRMTSLMKARMVHSRPILSSLTSMSTIHQMWLVFSKKATKGTMSCSMKLLFTLDPTLRILCSWSQWMTQTVHPTSPPTQFPLPINERCDITLSDQASRCT